MNTQPTSDMPKSVLELERQNKELRDDARFLRSTVDALSAHICVLDESGKILATNRAWNDFAATNSQSGHLSPLHCTNYFDVCDHAVGPEAPDASAFASGLRYVIRGVNEKFVLEYACHSPSKKRWYKARVTRFADGLAVRAVVSHEDITERKLTQSRLVASEIRYRRLFESAKDGILILNAASGEIVDVNPFLMEMLGYTHADFYGKQLWEIGLFKDIASNKSAFKLHQDEKYIRYEDLPLKTKNGKAIWVEFVSNEYDVEGLPVIQCNVREITVRKAGEDALRASEARFRQLAENINEVFWITNISQDEVLYVSPAYERIWGRSCESLYDSAQTWADSIHFEDRELLGRNSLTLQQGGKSEDTFRIVRPDGSIRWIHAHATAIRNEAGEVFRIVGTATDITDNRKLEDTARQAQKMEAIGQLAGGVAHDFNNQLSVIMGYASLLMDQLADPKLKGYAAKILLSSRNSEELTKKLLAFSRKGQFQSAPLSIHTTLVDTMEMLKRTVDKRVEIKRSLNADFDVIAGDSSQIQNAFLNLAVNARDAMNGCGRISFETENVILDSQFVAKYGGEMLPGRYIRVCISDTGTGMTDEVKRHLFEPFFTTKPVGKGTGMGLASVFGTIKNHKGIIDVYSELGHGTTFKLYLPVVEKLAESERKAAALPKKCRAYRILLVDDEEILSAMLVEMLRKGGHSVTEAANGRAAVDMYRQNWANIDLVILDMIMPELNGPDTFSAMKKINPQVKALLSTGFSLNAEVQAVLNEGAVGFIQKPFMPDTLLELIERKMNAH